MAEFKSNLIFGNITLISCTLAKISLVYKEIPNKGKEKAHFLSQARWKREN